jgi:DNA-binding transcriptional LysR family regulator
MKADRWENFLNLEALTDFNLVVAHGGFSRASRASGRPKATLSRHVIELEASLGIRLLERAGKSFRMTEEGKALSARTVGLLNEVADVARELVAGQGHPRGRLRVSSPITFGYMAMGRLAANFAQRYPDVQVEVTIEDRMVDLIEESYDVVIRVNPRPNDELVGRCFYRDHLVVVAPPSLPRPAVFSTPLTNSEAVPAVVGIDSPDIETWTVVDGTTEKSFLRRAVLRLPAPPIIREAVLAHAGVAILAHDLVAADLAAGRMVCWGTLPNRSVEIWVLHTSRRLVSSKVAAFVNFLCEEYSDVRVLLKP